VTRSFGNAKKWSAHNAQPCNQPGCAEARRLFLTLASMNTAPTLPWKVELNDVNSEAHSLAEIDVILSRAGSMQRGRLWVGKDGGPRPWWHRFLGTQPRYVDSLFSLEWCDQYACLIFHDENWSEYRAIDEAVPVAPNEETRLVISHGEAKPSPVDECMKKDRAMIAVRECLVQNSRPSWLKYRYVG
jgi:hypothetical protein